MRERERERQPNKTLFLWLHIYLKFNVTFKCVRRRKDKKNANERETHIPKADKMKRISCLAAIPENQIENLYTIRVRPNNTLVQHA